MTFLTSSDIFERSAFTEVCQPLSIPEGVNIPGVVLVIELIDELEQLRQKIQILQRHLDL